MNRLASMAIVSALAASAWAAPAPAPAPLLLQAACPTAAPEPTRTWKGGNAEFTDYSAAAKAAGTAQVPLLETFIKKYPTSDYLNEAVKQQAIDLFQTGQWAPAVAAAGQLVKSPGATAAELVVADFVIASADPNTMQANDANLSNEIAQLKQAATCGAQLTSAVPPAGKAPFDAAFSKAAGFADYMAKDYAAAGNSLNQAIKDNPKDPTPYYWLGVVMVTKEQPDFNNGLYDLAKASVLAQGKPGGDTIRTYLNTVYNNYHGSADGIQDVLTAAQNNSGPVPVMSNTDVLNKKAQDDYNAQVEAQKHQLPPADSFPGIKARLLKPDMAADIWKATKGQGLGLDGIVKEIGVGGKSIDIAVGATDASAPADLHVTLITPLSAAKRPKVGEKVTVNGVADTYKVNAAGDNVMINFITGWVNGYQEGPKL